VKKRYVSEFTPSYEEAIQTAKRLAKELDSGKIDVSTLKCFDPVEGIDSVEDAVLTLLVTIEDEEEYGDVPEQLESDWNYIRQASVRYGYSVADVEEMFEAVKDIYSAKKFADAMNNGSVRKLVAAKAAVACAV
jgi:hypothetical protein